MSRAPIISPGYRLQAIVMELDLKINELTGVDRLGVVLSQYPGATCMIENAGFL